MKQSIKSKPIPTPPPPEEKPASQALCRVCGKTIEWHQIANLVQCLREQRERMKMIRMFSEVKGDLQAARAELSVYRSEQRPTPQAVPTNGKP